MPTQRRNQAMFTIPFVWMLLSVAVLLGNAGATAADSGETFMRIGHGYTVTINTQWVDGYGYRPIKFSIVPNTAPAADEVITVRLSTGYSMTTGSALVEQDIIVPAETVNGSPVAGEAIVRVPVYDGWNQLQIQFLRNGQSLPRLSSAIGLNTSLGGNTWWSGSSSSGEMQTLLIIDSASRLRGPVSNSNVITGSMGPGTTIVMPQTTNQNNYSVGGLANFDIAAVHPQELGASWLDLTSVDAIAVSLDELQAMQSQFPDQYQAVDAWVFSGGSLWVYGLEDGLARLGELNQTLALGIAEEDEINGWRNIRRPVNSYNRGFVDLDTVQTDETTAVADQSTAPDNSSDNLGSLAQKLRWRPLGFGTVAAVPLSKPDGAAEWDQVSMDLNSLPRSWIERHGLSPNSSNQDFWNFLIPGVGMPPVIAFEILITLFVVIIGPVNYLMLKRRRRLHLLVITVPVMAMIVTGGLFAYALVSDGLSVRVMARSFTYLDQRQKQAACWTRLSYYAGLAPSGGLVFADDVAVYPVQGIVDYRMMDLRQRETQWVGSDRDGNQRLGAGWLDSRTPMQLLTVRSRTSTYQLNITEQAGSAPSVQNLLGSRIQHLVLADSQGEYFFADNINLNDQQTLTPVTDAASQLNEMLDVILTSMPEGVPAPAQRYQYWRNTQDDTNMQVSQLELHINAATDMLMRTVSLPPRSYIAIVEKSPESQLGVASAEQESSFHIIFGRW